MNAHELNWDYPDPHIIKHLAVANEADGYGHINNSAYLKWLDRCVWSHCDDVHMGPEICREINRGFAAVRHEIDYIAAAYPDDYLAIANWVTLNDGKLRAERKFQIIRIADKKTLLRAHSFYVCTDLKTGRPARVPKEFKTAFMVLPDVATLLEKA